MTRRNDRARTPGPSRKYVAPMPGLAALEAELRGEVSLPASADQALLGYVAGHPGASVRTVILEARGRVPYAAAEETIRSLLREGRLLADPPGTLSGTSTRLYVADTAAERTAP